MAAALGILLFIEVVRALQQRGFLLTKDVRFNYDYAQVMASPLETGERARKFRELFANYGISYHSSDLGK